MKQTKIIQKTTLYLADHRYIKMMRMLSDAWVTEKYSRFRAARREIDLRIIHCGVNEEVKI